MDYEKAYKEALERAKELLSIGNADARDHKIVLSLFPELKESEDERIRKEIIDFIKSRGGFKGDWIAWLEKQGGQKLAIPKWKYKKDNTPLLRDSIILNKYGCVTKSPSGAIISDAWVLDYDELAKLPKEELEKQGEQKPVDKVEPKFKVGDWLCNGGGNPCKVKDIFGNYYELCSIEGYEYNKPISDIDADYHIWTIQDAKPGDVLYCEACGIRDNP